MVTSERQCPRCGASYDVRDRRCSSCGLHVLGYGDGKRYLTKAVLEAHLERFKRPEVEFIDVTVQGAPFVHVVRGRRS